jgi:tRNA A37 threonylcarbamoyltransferase TsaD
MGSKPFDYLRSDVASFFEPSIIAIQQAIREQIAAARVPITVCVHFCSPIDDDIQIDDSKSVLLVGGFAASNWLFSNLQTHLGSEGFQFCRPDGHL